MRGRPIRRRRLVAISAACGVALAAFAFGAALGEDGSAPAPSLASRLSPRQLAGERIVTGFPGTGIPRALKRMIQAGEVAGVILFEENLASHRAGRRLVARLQAIRRPPGLRAPLLVMVDQEGGLVKRLSGPPDVSAARMGRRGATFSRAQGRATAASLRAAGINVDLAPVLDVARPGGVIAETERGFGASSAAVAATAVPFAEGLSSGGVVPTAKHFPGLGAAAENTDFAVQRIGLPEATLREVDEAPYRRYVERLGARGVVMLSTAIYPALAPQPAAFVPAIATGELRQRLGFTGVSITDALESVAVRAFGGPARAARAGAKAGTDLLLFTDYRAAASAGQALLRRLRRSSVERSRFELSAGRVLELRHDLSS